MSSSYTVHERNMILALEMASKAMELGEVPVGAVITDADGTVIATGMNRVITDCDPTAHAEIVAMRQAGLGVNNYRLTNLNLYVSLEPCLMCTGAMIHARIKNLYFGAFDFKTGACSSVFNIINDCRHNHQIHVCGGILQEQCRTLLQSFFKKRRLEHKNAKQGSL